MLVFVSIDEYEEQDDDDDDDDEEEEREEREELDVEDDNIVMERVLSSLCFVLVMLLL